MSLVRPTFLRSRGELEVASPDSRAVHTPTRLCVQLEQPLRDITDGLAINLTRLMPRRIVCPRRETLERAPPRLPRQRAPRTTSLPRSRRRHRAYGAFWALDNAVADVA